MTRMYFLSVIVWAMPFTTLAGTAMAGMIPTIVVESVELTPSAEEQTGALDVWVDYDGTTPIEIAGFQLGIRLRNTDGAVRFTDVRAPQKRPFLLAPTSLEPVAAISPDGMSVDLGDFLTTGFASLDDGDALASLQFAVDPGVAGTFAIEISSDPNDSFLARSLSDFVQFQIQAGSISVVPEPTGAMFCVVSMVVFARRWRYACQLKSTITGR